MFSALIALLLATCSPMRPPEPPSAEPVTAQQPTLITPPTATGSRTLATVPSQRQSEGEASNPVIVRGTTPAAPAPRPASSETRGDTGDITLNFAGADIRDVIGAVLGQTLKLNYVIDPDVSGPVTFNVSRPLRRDEVLTALEAVLHSRGMTLLQTDGIVRVMLARSDGKPRTAAPIGAPGPGAVGERIELFPARYVSATDLLHVLEKILPPGQVMVANEAQQLLLARGTPDELQLAEDTVRIFDVDQLSGTSVALLPLKNAEAATLVVELQNIFDTARKDATVSVVRFLPVERLNAVMVLTRQPRYLDEARAWVERLDRTRNENERRIYVYYLQYGKAAAVAQTLQGALSGIDIEVKGPSTAEPQGIGAASGSADSTVPPPAPGFPTPPPLLGAPPAGQAPPAAAPAGATPRPSVRIEADETHNALLITATPHDYTLIRQVLEGIDTPPLQVLIEVTVAEVTLNNSLRYGVQYFLNSRGNGGGNISTLLTNTATEAIAPAVPGFSLSLTAANLQPRVILQALSDLTQTKVISTPRLLVLDNQTARLQVGDVVPIITQSAASTLTSSPLVLSNVQYKETGVVLEVTPRVNSNGFVTMEINQSVSDVVQTTSSTINSPTIRQRRLTSTISVKSANAILLGGLIQDQDNRDSSGIPMLQEIPVIGALFGNRDNTSGRTELIIFLTPFVLANDADTSDATDKAMRQFRSVLDRSTLPVPRVPPR